MVPDIALALDTLPWPASQGESERHTRERRAAMITLLERFVRGAVLRNSYDLKELGSAHARTDMQGYWELRSQGRMTETRLFGFFARPGAFVCTAFKPRSDFGGKADPRWLQQRQACEATWQGLFPGRAYLKTPWPVTTRIQVAAYTEGCDDD